MLHVSDEVRAALVAKKAVVALESTLIAHGMPWPENLEVGRALEQTVRDGGAIPATIAIVRGKPTVGVSGAELEKMARTPAAFKKCGAADLGPICAAGGDGATTVSATTVLAARAGIRLFATGGIGGVHRGDSADVSSDLATLAREPVAVVSAGAKAILDLPRTLEMLETLGVPVIGVRTSMFPAFYVESSGLSLEHRVESAFEAAALLRAHFEFSSSGVILAKPIAKESALDASQIEEEISRALEDAANKGVRGKAITPHLLGYLADATGKRSLVANRALALANAAFAAEVAVALAS